MNATRRAAPKTTSRTPRKPPPSATPPVLADVQLLDIKACCAPGAVGATWWRDAVAAGLAPVPAVKLPRCTRWRATEVHAFWAAFAASGGRLCTKGAK
jgi:hypothetical protein